MCSKQAVVGDSVRRLKSEIRLQSSHTTRLALEFAQIVQ